MRLDFIKKQTFLLHGTEADRFFDAPMRAADIFPNLINPVAFRSQGIGVNPLLL